ncbi:branched-chain amino acid aminotransferase [Stella humosa]|uniref:Probable branched-chain-amino-acid aminotransferase n=1 Tax=Stella humosa TaxID=94 RepID=A0A3N1KIP3_9PROT|nr:aminotransferase class IV [Stella humosa]ROP81443.1 branched-chain amino acid aminotransferase [Stella humosa]BBK32795.1 branched chain amino acid aminotransferase [Stella humosa]
MPIAVPIIHLNGAYLPEPEARLSPFDLGLQFGDGVYEVVSAWKGLLFQLEAHLDRLEDGLHATRIETGLSRQDWRSIVAGTARANELTDASVKIIVTRGLLPAGTTDPRAARPTVIAFATPYGHIGTPEQRAHGIRLMIGHQRGMAPDTLDPRYKHISRLQYQLARIEALAAGYDDVVWLSAQGLVEEAPRSNVFLVKKGRLRTPAAGVLHGITHRTFCELAAELDVPLDVGDVTPYDLFTADEVFTCSTSGAALPVRETAGRPVLGAVPGPVTSALNQLYWTKREAGWHGTPL